ncbi:hypothetical protein [Mucisphaera calidilacus]|uniref:Uncharacterized protein n=1 Tax=Mucisphaera calidilacus TaxID=2527982 RepID=A0A518BXN1_9BACT|nr:hypothetical protein [Mucisphaera calidilacus]QDU71730.1 hypothetical protein Pan265_15830 [Mucisphaera calidilacus]
MTKEPTPPENPGLQGTAFRPTTDAERADAIDQAFDYRGDVTLTLLGGKTVEGYLFDRVRDDRRCRVMAEDGSLTAVAYDDITEVVFTGRDPATGRSWENWMRIYAERKQAGLEASLDEHGRPVDVREDSAG